MTTYYSYSYIYLCCNLYFQIFLNTKEGRPSKVNHKLYGTIKNSIRNLSERLQIRDSAQRRLEHIMATVYPTRPRNATIDSYSLRKTANSYLHRNVQEQEQSFSRPISS